MKADTLARTLLFCTLRVTNHDAGGNGKKSTGTGFIFDAAHPEDGNRSFWLITNKHVLENAAAITLDFLVRNSDDSGPELGKTIEFVLTPTPGTRLVDFFGHPDPAIDVAVLNLNGVLNQLFAASEPPPFFRALCWDNLPTQEALTEFDSIEELTFVGYPRGLRDPSNFTPIVRKGITATPIGIPYGGLPSFLLDGAVFGGSSGSPVYIFNQGTYASTRGVTTVGTRFFLVGIIAQNYNSIDELAVQGLTAAQPFVEIAQTLHLGVAFSATAIIETMNHALASVGRRTGAGLQEYR